MQQIQQPVVQQQQISSASSPQHYNNHHPHHQQLHASVSLGGGVQASSVGIASKESVLHQGNAHGNSCSNLQNPSSPSGQIKFPPFSTTSVGSVSQKQKFLLNNTNVLPKKIQQKPAKNENNKRNSLNERKAKMISLNLQNQSLSQGNQNSQSARPNGGGDPYISQAAIAAASAISSMGHHHSSLSNGQNLFSASVPITRHPSYQAQNAISPSATSAAFPTSLHSKNLSNQQLNYGSPSQSQSSFSQLASTQNLSQHQQQQQVFGSTRHRGHAGNYSSLLSNLNTKQNSQSPIAAFNTNLLQNHSSVAASANTTDRDQKRQEQSQLLEKYKGTPFLNYMFLDHPTSPLHSPHSTNFFKEGSHGLPQSATHSRNASATSMLLQSQPQNQIFQQQSFVAQPSSQFLHQPQFHERKKSSLLENRSQVLQQGTTTATASPQQQLMTAAPAENQKQDTSLSTRWSNSSMSKNVFNYQYVIGKGGFGKVWRVENKKSKQPFAMKEMSKSKFLVNMNYAFQDRDNLYLVMDLVSGGDLRYHIGRHRRFKEPQTRFFIACIVIGLEYLHGKNVIHRDIKPENLVLDTDGYVKMTDLGVARVWKPENSQDTSGTPGYMAPEVMCRQNHGIAVDYFAVGVIAYEFMMGRRPYLGRNRKEIRDQILSKQVQIKKHEIPDGWSIEAADFINRMIQRKPANRLGFNGPDEVKQHPWLKSFPWEKLLNKQLEAPFVPQAIEDNNEYRQQISVDGEDTNEDLIQQNTILLRKNSVQNLFSGYNFDSHEAMRQQNQASLLNNNQTDSTHSTNNTNYPSDRSQSALNTKKASSSFV